MSLAQLSPSLFTKFVSMEVFVSQRKSLDQIFLKPATPPLPRLIHIKKIAETKSDKTQLLLSYFCSHPASPNQANLFLNEYPSLTWSTPYSSIKQKL